jgi:hypothetical protein
LVTPELAKLFLESQGRNRTPVEKRIKLYAKTMALGEWTLTPQGLIFDQQDKLIDGQHRLLAVIESGRSIVFHCTWGVPKEIMMVLDQGTVRKPYQAAMIQGITATNNDFAVLRVMTAPTTKQTPRDIEGVKETLKLFEKYKESIYFANKHYEAYKSKPVQSACFRAPVARAFYTQDHERLQQFLYVLDTGIPSELNEDSAAVLLRNLAISNKGASNTDKMRFYRLSLSALSAFLKRKRLVQLNETEKNPFFVDGLPD